MLVFILSLSIPLNEFGKRLPSLVQAAGLTAHLTITLKEWHAASQVRPLIYLLCRFCCVFCSCSPGAGEHITRSALARSVGEALKEAGEDADTHEILHRVLLDRFSSEFGRIRD